MVVCLEYWFVLYWCFDCIDCYCGWIVCWLLGLLCLWVVFDCVVLFVCLIWIDCYGVCGVAFFFFWMIDLCDLICCLLMIIAGVWLLW